jgi:hypothetical protein
MIWSLMMCASCTAVKSFLKAMYSACFVNQSTTTRIASYNTCVIGSLKTGKPVTKSIEMSDHGALGSSIACISL